MMALAVSHDKEFGKNQVAAHLVQSKKNARLSIRRGRSWEGEPAGIKEPRPSSGVGRHEVVQGGRVSNSRRLPDKRVRAGSSRQGDFFVSRQRLSALKGYFYSDFRPPVVFVVMALAARIEYQEHQPATQ